MGSVSPGGVGPVRAHVSRSFFGPWQIAVWVDMPGRGVWYPNDNTGDTLQGGGRWVQPENPAVNVPPTLLLDDEVARVLLDALAEYYGGTGSVRTLRADMEHERKRVDKLIDRLLDDTVGKRNA